MPFDLRMVILNRKISEKSKQKKDLDQNHKSPIIADKFIFQISYWSSHALLSLSLRSVKSTGLNVQVIQAITKNFQATGLNVRHPPDRKLPCFWCVPNQFIVNQNAFFLFSYTLIPLTSHPYLILRMAEKVEFLEFVIADEILHIPWPVPKTVRSSFCKIGRYSSRSSRIQDAVRHKTKT